MDSDLYYYIFVGGVMLFSFLNSLKKAKAEKEKRKQAMRNQQQPQPPAIPQDASTTESKQFDEWFNQTEPQPEPQQPITSLEDLIIALNKPKRAPQTPKPRAASAMPKVPKVPKVPKQPAQQHSIAIEPPEMEGQRATADNADDVYSQHTDQLPSSSHDWRRAIIAHEILKRKF